MPEKRPAEDQGDVSPKRVNTSHPVTKVDDVNIKSINALLPPILLLEELPCEEHHAETVMEGRASIGRVFDEEDDRLVVIVGPCSVHDPKAAMEYAHKLRKLMLQFQKDLVIVMRVYFEKPRTTVGWKGLINDPNLDGSFQINKGLRTARELLLQISSLGLPTAVEFLDTISPQYLADLVSWGAIGARTTESQVHRELASGLSMPVGFKNGTSGDVKLAVDAVTSARNGHSFLSVTKQGLSAIVHTRGNKYGHVILRGGSSGTNYDAESIAKASAEMVKAGLKNRIVVDCSHGNSLKKHTNQPKVVSSIAEQLAAGGRSIIGVMLESNIAEGAQKLDPGVTPVHTLKYGVSVTDACIDLATTAEALSTLAKAVQARRGAAKQ